MRCDGSERERRFQLLLVLSLLLLLLFKQIERKKNATLYGVVYSLRRGKAVGSKKQQQKQKRKGEEQKKSRINLS